MSPAPCTISWCAGSISRISSRTTKTRPCSLRGLAKTSSTGNARSMPGYLWTTTPISFSRAASSASQPSCEGFSRGTPNTLTAATAAPGHLFENRYKSILCDEDNYLLSLIRYIHVNPVRAGIVTTLKELDTYSWSGHSAIMGNVRQDWMDTANVLSQFGARKKDARNAYHKFVVEGMTMGKNLYLTGGGLIRSKGGWSQVVSARRSGKKEEFDERILGSGDFVNAILKETEEKTRLQLKLRRTGKTIAMIIEEECKQGHISPNELKAGSRRRKVSTLRATIAKRGLNELGLYMAEIARHVGVTTSSIAKAVARLEEEG